MSRNRALSRLERDEMERNPKLIADILVQILELSVIPAVLHRYHLFAHRTAGRPDEFEIFVLE